MSAIDREVKRAVLSDLPAVMRLIECGRQTMRLSGNLHQWEGNYPPQEQLRQDIARGHSYLLMEGGESIATFAFIPGPDITYRRIEQGRWLDETRAYAVIHRVAALPSRHGVMKDILRYCFSIIGNIRIDTHRDNTIMRHCLASCGFSYCGIIHLLNGDERLAYQKIIR